MKTIGEVADQELIWRQPSAVKSRYELRTGEDVVGTIAFERSTLATAEAEGGRWTFKREGFWRQQITVRREGSNDNAAVFKPHALGGGDLVTADGHRFELTAPHFWHRGCGWEEGGHVLVSFRQRLEALKTEALVEIAPDAVGRTELPLLVLLGWYLLLLTQKDIALSAAAVATASRAPVMH